MSKRFESTMDGSVVLSADDIWPDGDAPQNPTARDVLNVLKSQGRLLDVLVDWNLDEEFGLVVREVSGG